MMDWRREAPKAPSDATGGRGYATLGKSMLSTTPLLPNVFSNSIPESLRRNFEALATSYIVVLDKNGKVVYTGSGADQHLAPVLARL